jgi:hypothetical protein
MPEHGAPGVAGTRVAFGHMLQMSVACCITDVTLPFTAGPGVKPMHGSPVLFPLKFLTGQTPLSVMGVAQSCPPQLHALSWGVVQTAPNLVVLQKHDGAVALAEGAGAAAVVAGGTLASAPAFGAVDPPGRGATCADVDVAAALGVAAADDAAMAPEDAAADADADADALPTG